MNIWYGTGENAQFSNLTLRPFTGSEGREYYSVEHAYQVWKSGVFNNKLHANPAWKSAGTKLRGYSPRTSEGYNVKVMKRAIELSFQQNTKAREELLATGDTVFTHNQDNTVWNKLFPKLLMEVREELK